MSFRFLGFEWEIYGLPLNGLVTVFFTNPHRYRKRVIAMIVAGPLANFVASGFGVIFFLSNTTYPLSLFLIGWALANAWLFAITIIPSRWSFGNRIFKSDGYRCGQTLILSDEQIRHKCFSAKFQIEQQNLEKLDKLTVEDAIARYEENPNQLVTLTRLIDKLSGANDPRQTKYIDKFISYPDMPPSAGVAFLDAFLTRHLQSGTITTDECFDRYSERLLDASKGSLTCLGTRDSVLIDLGRLDEGMAILEEVIRRTDSAIDRSYALIFLSLAEKKKRNFEAAVCLARKAKSIDPNCPALARVVDLFAMA